MNLARGRPLSIDSHAGRGLLALVPRTMRMDPVGLRRGGTGADILRRYGEGAFVGASPVSSADAPYHPTNWLPRQNSDSSLARVGASSR